MRIKTRLASFQAGPADFLPSNFPLFLLNCRFNNLRIKPYRPGCLDQIFVANRIFFIQFQCQPNDAVDLVCTVFS